MSQIFNVPLAKFAASVKEVSQDEFTNRFSTPFLLLEKNNGVENKGYATIAAEDTSNVLSTALAGTTEVEEGEEYVFTLEKTENNTFSNMVCLGRSVNNDIIVANPAVSKLHAYFKYDPSRKTFTVTDTGSTNGTQIGERDLSPNRPVKLASGQAMVFGKAVRATFFEPFDFFEYLGIYRRFGKTK